MAVKLRQPQPVPNANPSKGPIAGPAAPAEKSVSKAKIMGRQDEVDPTDPNCTCDEQ